MGKAELHVFAVQERAFVESAHRVERRTREGDARPVDPIDPERGRSARACGRNTVASPAPPVIPTAAQPPGTIDSQRRADHNRRSKGINEFGKSEPLGAGVGRQDHHRRIDRRVRADRAVHRDRVTPVLRVGVEGPTFRSGPRIAFVTTWILRHNPPHICD